MSIGLKIKELRQLKKVTQEELANAVGISTQAVSKWENGGTPDIELIPQICDFFEITIDELFDRKSDKYDSIDQKFADYISNTEIESKFMKAFEMCWNMQKSLMTNHETKNDPMQKFLDSESGANSKMISKTGYSLMRIHKDNMFFFLAPQPKNGYYNKVIESEEKQIEFLNFLASKDVYDALVVLNKRANTYFTSSYFLGIGITADRANEIIQGLLQYGFLMKNSVQIDDHQQTIYVYRNTPALIMLFTALDFIVKRQDCWCYCTDGDKQYFEIDKK
jgi:transcriptional regulator with XRE-family HTH domain